MSLTSLSLSFFPNCGNARPDHPAYSTNYLIDVQVGVIVNGDSRRVRTWHAVRYTLAVVR